MKFRQFEFSFFPRIRGKKKKKSKFSDTSLDRNFPLDKNFNYSKISYENSALNKSISSAFETESDVSSHGVQYLRSNSDYSEYQEQCCYYSQTYPLPKLLIDLDAENLCSCAVCTNSLVHSVENPLYFVKPVQTPVGTPICTRNTIPRTRTRIKTNPWLPSPRTTPSLSPADTSESIVYSSNEFPPRYTLDLPLTKKEVLSNHNLAQLNHIEDDDNNLSKVTEEDVDDIKANIEILQEVPILKTRKRFSYTDFLTYDTDGSKCTSPVVEQIEILGNCSCNVCFEYEENLDDLLEQQEVIPRDATFLSIKDLLEDDYHTKDICQREIPEDLPDVVGIETEHVETDSLAVLDKSMDQSISSEGEVSDVISNMDLTFYDEGYMLESIDTGYGSGVRDSDENSDEEFEPPQATEEPSFDEAELEWDNDPSAQSLQGYDGKKERTFSVSDSTEMAECKRCVRPRSRSLADIENSLDEKVTLLREEKYYVQRKIREAKNEEEIRRRQVQLFRSYSVDNRKEVLLQTLNDLKMRLENQSTRLQSSYDAVLSIQRSFSKRKPKLPVIETMI